MTYWYRAFYIMGSYIPESNVSDIIPNLYFWQEISFTPLLLELGGKIKKRKNLEKIVQ